MSGDALSLRGRSGGGDDRLFGGTGNDRLFGDAVVQRDRATGGDDVLVGGAGRDQLWGDADPTVSDLSGVTRGADRFVFANGSGSDVILDFQNGRDVVDLRGFAGIDGFAEVRARSVASGGDTVIDLGAAAGGTARADVLTLDGFALSRLDGTDFLIA